MRHDNERTASPASVDLVQYAEGIARMQRAMQRIHVNKQAVRDSLLRAATALRTISEQPLKTSRS